MRNQALRSLKDSVKGHAIGYEFYYLLKLLRDAPVSEWVKFRRMNLFRKTYGYTMVGYPRLNNAYNLAHEIDRMQIPGAIVECGVWRGGCSATMAWVAQQTTSDRHVWLFDSFEGLPSPTEVDGAFAYDHIGNYAALEQAAREVLFDRLKLNPAQIHLVKGWFQDTIPQTKVDIGPIALLRLDGDLYESTKVCLENLYDQISPGGFIIIDDYGSWPGCQLATDEFLKDRDIKAGLTVIDRKGRYFHKPA